MFVGALRGHKLPPASRKLIDHIDGSVGALDGLFTSLLDISRLDAGVVEAAPQTVVLEPLIARVCADLEGEAAAKGVALVHAATSVAVHSDPVHLERILRNLVGNAVRYTAAGRVVVGMRRAGAGLARLEIWDTGPGVPDQERGAIFEEFYQLGGADRDRAKGLGLGLAIVRRLTGILGHRLDFDSRLGKGSVFRLTMPRVAPPGAARPRPAPRAAEEPAGLILVIDDEPAIRIAMAELLAGWGHRVLSADGADEAHVLLAAEGRAPDLILSDYRLRGPDGIAAIRRLHAAFGETPAILLTGDTAPSRIREAQASGYPLLHKPVPHGRLRAAVTNLLRRREPAPAAE
jgi:CheY-like chemotaxis protein